MMRDEAVMKVQTVEHSAFEKLTLYESEAKHGALLAETKLAHWETVAATQNGSDVNAVAVRLQQEQYKYKICEAETESLQERIKVKESERLKLQNQVEKLNADVEGRSLSENTLRLQLIKLQEETKNTHSAAYSQIGNLQEELDKQIDREKTLRSKLKFRSQTEGQ